MEIERLVKLDEEAILLGEDFPLIKSLSISRHIMALSVCDEVPHSSFSANIHSSAAGLGFSGGEPRSHSTTSTTSSSKTIRYYPAHHSDASKVDEEDYEKCLDMDSSNPDKSTDQGSNDSSSTTSSSYGSSSTDFFRGTQALSILGNGRVKKNEMLTGFVVSRWDNIVGPQCVYLWTEEYTSIFYPHHLPQKLSRVVKYATDHTVDHQDVDGNCMSPSTQRITLCVVPELSLVYISISIRVPSEIDTILEFASSSSMTANDPDQPVTSIPHAVSILGELKFLSHFLLLRPLIISWLSEFAPKIGVLLCKNKLQSSTVNSWCAEFCKTITSLKTCWVQDVCPNQSQRMEDPKVSSSEVDKKSKFREYSGNSKLEFGKPRIKETCDYHYKDKKDISTTATTLAHSSVHSFDTEYLPPNLRHVSHSSYVALLTSHLSSYGSSIVVGSDDRAINQVIRFLLCFSSNSEGYCSRYSLNALPDTFMKGLFIQGLVLGGIGERSISFNQIASNKLPLTYVELGSKFKLKQVNPRIHCHRRANILTQELRSLWTSSIFVSPAQDPYQELVQIAAGFVTRFISDLNLLPSERRYGRLLLFRREIHSKAMGFIAYLHSLRHLSKPQRLQSTKSIPEIFNYDEHEYAIIQVAAEKLKPGILTLLS